MAVWFEAVNSETKRQIWERNAEIKWHQIVEAIIKSLTVLN